MVVFDCPLNTAGGSLKAEGFGDGSSHQQLLTAIRITVFDCPLNTVKRGSYFFTMIAT